MKFTKENVCRLLGDYRTNKNGIRVLAQLESAIMDLDDTPEKVVVPNYLAEWYESQASSHYNIQRMIKNLLNGSLLEEMVLVWLNRNYSKYGLRDRFDLLALIRINGYTIEPERLYYIPLPDLKTSDGMQQMLSKQKNGMNYFACRQDEKLQQRYTKAELERVPEVYKPFAKPIEEEEE